MYEICSFKGCTLCRCSAITWEHGKLFEDKDSNLLFVFPNDFDVLRTGDDIIGRGLVVSIVVMLHERYGVSNHRPHDCLYKGLFSLARKKTQKLGITGFL